VSGKVLFIEIDAKALNAFKTTRSHGAARSVESCATCPGLAVAFGTGTTGERTHGSEGSIVSSPDIEELVSEIGQR
jgi:hypothetical protein